MTAAPLTRRAFLKRGLASAAALKLAGPNSLSQAQTETSSGNPLPRWRGFNLTDFTSPSPSSRRGTSDEDIKWIVDWGFDFIRLPMAYPRYLDFDRSKDITPAEVYKINEAEVDRIEAFVRNAQEHGLHVSLNLHRA